MTQGFQQAFAALAWIALALVALAIVSTVAFKRLDATQEKNE
jgi:hypothetical protein